MKKGLCFAAICAAAVSLTAENVFYNGSFELGLDGVSMRRQICHDSNPELKFVPLELAAGAPGEGKNSLLVRNQTSDGFELYFREVFLKPHTDYVLEFKGRCTAGKLPGELKFCRIKKNDRGSLDWRGETKHFTLTQEWQTVKLCFNTKEELDGYSFCYVSMIGLSEKNASDLYFDGFKLYEAKTEPTDSVNIAVTTKEHLTVADRTAKVPVNLKIGNFDKHPFYAKVTLSAVNDWNGKKFTKQFDVKLAAGEIKNYTAEFQLEYGCWTLNASAPGVRETATLDGSIAVIGKYTAKKLDLNHDFCIGFNAQPEYAGRPKYKRFGYIANNTSVESLFEMYSKMGCRLFREIADGYSTTCWFVFEPEENKFDFRHFDYSLKLYEKYNIECFPCLGRGNFLHALPGCESWWNIGWPAWVDKQCHEVERAPYNWKNIPEKGYVFMPPMELWRKYVRTVATRAKGKIHFYEIFNEPNGMMGAKSYAPYMKAAYEEIKKIDKNAMVVGACLTEDFGAKTGGFLNELLDHGGGDYMDIISFHPYSSRELGSPNPADQTIAEMREHLKKRTGREIPIWNSEVYYLYDTNEKDGSVQTTVRPNHIALRLLTDLGEGVKQAPCPCAKRQLWKLRLIPHHAFRTNVEQIPDYNFVVCNALARFFEAARPVAKHRPSGGVIIYGFRKDGHGVAAIWNYERRKGVKADLSRFTVYDLFGNEIKSGVLPLTDAPYYLKPGKNMDDAAFFDALKGMKIALNRPVLVSSQVRQAGNLLYATLVNQSATPVEGLAGFQGENTTAANAVSFNIAPRGTFNIVMSLKKSRLKSAPAFSVFVNGQLTMHPVSIVKETCVKAGEVVKLSSESGFSGEWKMTKKDGRLNFHIQVKDLTDSGKDNKNDPWEQDCVELFFDFDPLSLSLNNAEAYTPDVVRLFLLPRLAGEKQVQIWSKKKTDVKTSFKTTKEGYEVTVSMPCKTDAVGFALKIDNAKPGSKTYENLCFTAGQLPHENRLHFNIIDFK